MADSFSDALVAAYANNPQIMAERDRQRATDEGVPQALSGLRPNASAEYFKGRQRTDFGGTGWNNSDNDRQSLTVRQPLFRGGGTFSSFNSAKQRARAGEYRLKGVEQQVLLDAVASYMDVASAATILELSRNNQAALGQQLQAANERFSVGEVTRTDVAQSQARVSVAQAQVINAEGNLIGAIASFQRVIGYEPDGVLTPPQELPELPYSLEEAIAKAKASNPELMQAVHAAKSSHYDVWTNKSTLLPRVDIVGSLSRQDGAGILGTSQFDQDSVGLQVSIPLYQSGAEYSRVREAKNIARQRKYEELDTARNVEQLVIRAWERFETANSTIASRDMQIQAAEVALDGVRQEQQYGARTVLDVLDAEQELFAARINLVQAQRDRVVAAYNVLLNLGSLTPQHLHLAVDQYDPREHYDDIKWQAIGF